MDKPLELSDFDILGIIKLTDVAGIEKYVTPIYGETKLGRPVEYFSRSKEYYNVKSLTELSNTREELKKLLTGEKSKRNFVILENMLNCSAKVYFKKLEAYIDKPSLLNQCLMEVSRMCMLEDTRNLLAIMEGKGNITLEPRAILPTGEENCVKRAIEMDNKAILYMFAKHLKLDENPKKIQIVTPGYGSLYIGPFLYAMYGYDFTNVLKSKYIKETSTIRSKKHIKQLVSNSEIFNPEKKIVILDDNIGTGETITELREQLEDKGVNCYKIGAVQYNWLNYFKVKNGEKNINKFSITDIDIITPFNYAGHKLYDHAIEALHSSGSEYEAYLKSKSYRLPIFNDTIGAIKRGLIAAEKSMVSISGSI